MLRRLFLVVRTIAFSCGFALIKNQYGQGPVSTFVIVASEPAARSHIASASFWSSAVSFCRTPPPLHV